MKSTVLKSGRSKAETTGCSETTLSFAMDFVSLLIGALFKLSSGDTIDHFYYTTDKSFRAHTTCKSYTAFRLPRNR